MNLTTMRQVSWIGDEYLDGAIKGIVLSFHGLGHNCEKKFPSTLELEWARLGWLVVFPYYGPWSWMNRNSRIMVDELIDAVYMHFNLEDNIPLASTGVSMGGHAALLYTRYAKRTISACIAESPVCDLQYHYINRQGIAKTVYSSFISEGGDFDILFSENSPINQADKMPDIPYLFVHGDSDAAVNKQAHSDKMVMAMKKRNLNVEYMEVHGMGHGVCIPLAVTKRMVDFLSVIK